MIAIFNISQLQKRFEKQEVISKQDLWELYQQLNPTPNVDTFRWWIHHLKQKKVIRSLTKNTFSLEYKPVYHPKPNSKQIDFYRIITNQYPNLKLCIWSTQWLNEFMLHQPGRFVTIIETESYTVESVFHFLQDSSISNLFIQPQQKEVEKYIAENTDSVVVQTLKTKAPIQLVNKVVVPTLEKMLVDIFADKILFNAYQGSELVFIFNSAYQKYELNITKLLHYASRRGKQQELSDFLYSKTDIPPLND